MIDASALPTIFRHIDVDLLARFKGFHESNTWVYDEFVALAEQMRATSRKKYSAWVIINVIRWHKDLRSTGAFKINNDFIALYARLLIYHRPEFKDFFELRTMKPHGRKKSHEQRAREGESDFPPKILSIVRGDG